MRTGSGTPRRTAHRALGVLLAIVLVAVTAVSGLRPATALATRMIIGPGLASCPAGYVCLWTFSNFTGTGYAFFNSEYDYYSLPAPFNGIENFSWSFYSHGNTHDIRFFRDTQSGDSFILCKGTWIAELPSNAEVTPPAAYEPGRGWRDTISSHKFGAFC
ncbi:peptidase inhibitor family I36 protein [Phytohabitans sp. LJ34]|uniref:peptidase inhibitor family I36 protein n=1 Tax=Phytohabitans sp. LJ34 TaxID=3452217 RepID=UPI003F8C47C6